MQTFGIPTIGVGMEETEFLEKVREAQMLLPAITKLWHQAMQQHLNEHGEGLSGLQFGVMRIINLEPLTSSELSRKFQVDPSTLVPTVNGLEKRGLLVRTRDEKDRRRQPLYLTEQGSELIKSIPFPFENNDLTESLRQMGLEKTEQLLSLLREVIRGVPNGETILSEVHDRLEYHRNFEKC